jgi:hypothetical protein
MMGLKMGLKMAGERREKESKEKKKAIGLEKYETREFERERWS